MSHPICTEEVSAALTQYIADEILEGEDVGLESDTPLLEYGILNSMEIVRLVAFVGETFAISISSDMIVATNFKDIATLTQLITSLADTSAQTVAA